MGIATQTSDGLKFSTTYMYVKNSSGTTLASIKSDGNVGIGTATPTEQLSIFASVAGSPATSGTGANGNFAIESSNGNSLYFGSYNGSPYGCWLQVSNYANQSLTYPLILQPNGGNIGIGTASPDVPLHVNSSSDQHIILSGSTNPYIRFQESSTSRAYIQWHASYDSLLFRNEEADNFDFLTHATGGGLNIRLKGSDHDVWGSVYADENGGSHTIGFLDGDQHWALQHIKDTSWDFRINNSSKMFLDADGNVGIGTASPERKLHIFKGESGGETSNSDSSLVLENSSHTYLQFLTPSTVESGLLFGDGNNDVGALVYDHADDEMRFVINAAVKAVIDSSGNVGIGTASPVEKLDVAGKQRITQNIVSNATYQMLAFGSNRGINDYGGLNKDYWRIKVVTPGASTTGEGSAHGYGDLVFSGVTGSNTTYLNRFVIRASGNIGIGTNVPSAKLHIQSDGSHDEGAEIVLRHSNNNNTDVVSTISFQNSGGQVAMIQGGTTNANNTGYISFFTDSTGTSGERMRIQGNGYVGIGTATAYSPLQVYSSADQKILLSGSTNPYIRWQNGGSNRAYIRWLEGNSALTFVNSSGDNFDFLTHDSTGALALRLRGNDSDTWGYVYAYEGNNAAHEVGFLDGDGAWAARHIKDTSWDFRINNSSKMTINSSGTVAVGGTTLLTNEGMVLNRSGGAGYVAFYDGSGGAKWNIQRNSGVSNCLRIHAYNNTSQGF